MKDKEIEDWICKAGCEESYYLFLNWVFQKIWNRKFVPNWHLERLCEIMEKIYHGELVNVVITIPPRHSKTLCAVVGFIPWVLCKQPLSNFLHLSYSESLALKNSHDASMIIEHPEYKNLWGHYLAKGEQAKKMWRIAMGGGVYATSSGGAVTGFGAGVKGLEGFSGMIVLDDPQKANEERFELSRKTIIENFENVISSRRNNPKTPVVLIQQRLHEEDLAGYLLSGKSSVGEFTHINLPCIKEGEPNSVDPRNEGEVLWENAFSLEKANLMSRKNPMLFAGQYQQRPAPMEGNMLKKSWIQRYLCLPDSDCQTVISCDLSFKESGNSNVALSVYSVYKTPSGRKIYLVDQVCKKMGFPESKIRLTQLIEKYPHYQAILIEDKANGSAMVDDLKKIGFSSVLAVPAESSKVHRFARVTDFYEAGDVLYPDSSIAPWIEEHLHEMMVFPNGKNDDRVDAEAHFLNYYRKKMAVVKFLNI